MKVVYSLLLTAAFAVPSLAQPGPGGPGGPGGRGGFGGGQFGGQGGPGGGQGQEIEKLRDQVRQLEEKLKKAQQPQGGDRKPEVRKDEPRKEEPRKTEGKQPEVKKPEIKRDVEVRVFEKKPDAPKGGEPQKGETFQFRVAGPGGPGGQPNVMFMQGMQGGMPAGMNKLTPEEQMILKTLLAKASGMSQGQPGQPQTRQLNPQPLPPKQPETRPQPGSGEGARRGPDWGFNRGGEGSRGGDRPLGGGEKKPSVEERLDRLEKMIQELSRSQQRR